MKSGTGIVTRGADRRWRKVTNREIVNITKEEFVITRLEVRTDGVKRLRIVDELPRPFPALIQQGRWASQDVFDWFKKARVIYAIRFREDDSPGHYPANRERNHGCPCS